MMFLSEMALFYGAESASLLKPGHVWAKVMVIGGNHNAAE
jgi:hypothetical protein